jgi:hypothetical protein
LIHGRVNHLGGGATVTLWFMPASGRADHPHNHTLTQNLELPESGIRDFAAAIATIALTQVAPVLAPERAGMDWVPVMQRLVGKLRPLIDRPPPVLGPNVIGAILHAYALGTAHIGVVRGDNQALEASVAAFRRLLTALPRKQNPQGWAMTKNNLGTALLTLGERESGTARLEEAVKIFYAALKKCPQDRAPLAWAKIQDNLGNALSILGEREGDTTRLKDAVAAYRAALQERTRFRAPMDWAGTQNNLGNALRHLGEREGGTAWLEEAVTAYRLALTVFTPESADYYFQIATNNLAQALELLAQRKKQS